MLRGMEASLKGQSRNDWETPTSPDILENFKEQLQITFLFEYSNQTDQNIYTQQNDVNKKDGIT